MKKSLTEIYFENLPIEIRYITQQIIEFTQLAPPVNIVAYREYLARASVLFDIDKEITTLRNTCSEKDEYYYMKIIPLVEKVNRIMQLQRNVNNLESNLVE